MVATLCCGVQVLVGDLGCPVGVDVEDPGVFGFQAADLHGARVLAGIVGLIVVTEVWGVLGYGQCFLWWWVSDECSDQKIMSGGTDHGCQVGFSVCPVRAHLGYT